MVMVAAFNPALAALIVTVKVVELPGGMLAGKVMPLTANAALSGPERVIADTTKFSVLDLRNISKKIVRRNYSKRYALGQSLCIQFLRKEN
jgi:hypothetical protein